MEPQYRSKMENISNILTEVKHLSSEGKEFMLLDIVYKILEAEKCHKRINPRIVYQGLIIGKLH